MTLSAPFFRALVVSATKSTRKEEPTTSSSQPPQLKRTFCINDPAVDGYYKRAYYS